MVCLKNKKALQSYSERIILINQRKDFCYLNRNRRDQPLEVAENDSIHFNELSTYIYYLFQSSFFCDRRLLFGELKSTAPVIAKTLQHFITFGKGKLKMTQQQKKRRRNPPWVVRIDERNTDSQDENDCKQQHKAIGIQP